MFISFYIVGKRLAPKLSFGRNEQPIISVAESSYATGTAYGYSNLFCF